MSLDPEFAQLPIAREIAIRAALRKLANRVVAYLPKGDIPAHLDCDIELRKFAREALELLDQRPLPPAR